MTYFCFNFYCFRETDIKNIATINIQKTKIMASGPITSWQIDGKQWKQWLTIFLGSKITADGDYSYEIEKMLTPWKESYDQPRQHIKKQRHYFVSKGPSSQSYGFSSGPVGCESWTIKKAEC